MAFNDSSCAANRVHLGYKD